MASFHPHFRLANLMNRHEVEWQARNVDELLKIGRREYGPDFESEIKQATILVNGRAIQYLNGLDTELKESDEVWTVLPSAGG